jgi:hypothetical protein
MDLCSEGCEIGIVGADNDSGVIGVLSVEGDEVLTVEGEDSPAVFDGESEDFVVWDACIRFARVVRGQDVMPEQSQCLHDGQREILV